MAEYIKKDEVIKLIREDKVEITPNLLTIVMLAAPNGYSAEDCYNAINDTCDRHINEIRNLPAADVRPVMEVEEAVDEAIRILNAINASGRMNYGDYSKLHDAICTISNNCGADMREET